MKSFRIGQKVETWNGNTGTVIRIDSNPKNKPVVVELDEEITTLGKTIKTGFYHYDQVK